MIVPPYPLTQFYEYLIARVGRMDERVVMDISCAGERKSVVIRLTYQVLKHRDHTGIPGVLSFTARISR